MESLREVIELLEGDWRERTDILVNYDTEIFDKHEGQKYRMRAVYDPTILLPTLHTHVLLMTSHDGKETFTDPIGFDTLEALLLYMMANGYTKQGVDAPPPLEKGP